MNHADAFALARHVAGYLRPYCDRIEIGGSIRRGKPEVRDIEIVCAPSPIRRQVGLFSEYEIHYPIYTFLEFGAFTSACAARYIKGKSRYRKYVIDDAINLDLFIVIPPAQWGVDFILRTGPTEFNAWLVTPRRKGGCMPASALMHDAGIYVNGRLIEMPEEIDFLNYLGLGWLEPRDRVPQWGRTPVLHSANCPAEARHTA